MSAAIDNRDARPEPNGRLEKAQGHSPATDLAINVARAAHKACVDAGIPATAVEVSLYRRGVKLTSGTFIDGTSQPSSVPARQT